MTEPLRFPFIFLPRLQPLAPSRYWAGLVLAFATLLVPFENTLAETATLAIDSLETGMASDSDESADTDAAQIRKWYQEQQSRFETLYRWLHAHPEVSLQERETAEYLAERWKENGFTVTQGVGGHGIVAVLENGPGPCVMLRTDLDALPVQEKTGLRFASERTTQSADGGATGVMHACGHDIHMTNVTAVGAYLSQHRKQWRGTLILIGQPAEERGLGAKAMLDDGLFTRFPKPDYALALHVESATPAGSIAVKSGYLLANVDSVDIEIHGRGGHGASPESTIDPIVQAAELVLSLQGIVAREIKPTEPAVVTVGSIHGGTKHNIIGERCHLQLTVRSYSPEVRQKLLDAIVRRAKGVAATWNAPEPTIAFSDGTPALENDAALTQRLTNAFRAAIGSDQVLPAEAVMGGEDFSQYGLAGVPILMYRLGVVAPERLERYQQLGTNPPSLHSPEFYPDLEMSLETGVVTMTVAALDLLQ